MSTTMPSQLASVKRCIARVREDYDETFLENRTKQDAIMLNLERACKTCLDMAARFIQSQQLGTPENSRTLFNTLVEKSVISASLADRMNRLVAFRRTSLYEHEKLDLKVVEAIITKHLDDFREFGETLVSKSRT